MPLTIDVITTDVSARVTGVEPLPYRDDLITGFCQAEIVTVAVRGEKIIVTITGPALDEDKKPYGVPAWASSEKSYEAMLQYTIGGDKDVPQAVCDLAAEVLAA